MLETLILVTILFRYVVIDAPLSIQALDRCIYCLCICLFFQEVGFREIAVGDDSHVYFNKYFLDSKELSWTSLITLPDPLLYVVYKTMLVVGDSWRYFALFNAVIVVVALHILSEAAKSGYIVRSLMLVNPFIYEASINTVRSFYALLFLAIIYVTGNKNKWMYWFILIAAGIHLKMTLLMILLFFGALLVGNKLKDSRKVIVLSSIFFCVKSLGVFDISYFVQPFLANLVENTGINYTVYQLWGTRETISFSLFSQVFVFIVLMSTMADRENFMFKIVSISWILFVVLFPLVSFLFRFLVIMSLLMLIKTNWKRSILGLRNDYLVSAYLFIATFMFYFR